MKGVCLCGRGGGRVKGGTLLEPGGETKKKRKVIRYYFSGAPGKGDDSKKTVEVTQRWSNERSSREKNAVKGEVASAVEAALCCHQGPRQKERLRPTIFPMLKGGGGKGKGRTLAIKKQKPYTSERCLF